MVLGSTIKLIKQTDVSRLLPKENSTCFLKSVWYIFKDRWSLGAKPLRLIIYCSGHRTQPKLGRIKTARSSIRKDSFRGFLLLV